jgi:hypothetical protein
MTEEKAIEKLLEAAIDAELILRSNPKWNDLKAIMHSIRGTKLGRDMLHLMRTPKKPAKKTRKPRKKKED